MTKWNRRKFLLGGAAGLVASGVVWKGSKLANEEDRVEFRALETTTGLRRKYWPIAQPISGWRKSPHNPVVGGNLGTCFDCCVLRENSIYRMWFSWRNKAGIGHAVSDDGVRWSDEKLVFAPPPKGGWKRAINRPSVLNINGRYMMWYAGLTQSNSAVGLAESEDGLTWRDMQQGPVLAPEESWEGSSVMCPNVIHEDGAGYKMWYSGGAQFEPLAIGYAESSNGVDWRRKPQPVLSAAVDKFDCARVAGSSVVADRDGYTMFYIGFRNVEEAGICVARSNTGFDNWERHPHNPILAPTNDPAAWDYDSIYRPAVLKENDRWLMWYNGRRKDWEQIGFAVHEGLDLGFSGA